MSVQPHRVCLPGIITVCCDIEIACGLLLSHGNRLWFPFVTWKSHVVSTVSRFHRLSATRSVNRVSNCPTFASTQGSTLSTIQPNTPSTLGDPETASRAGLRRVYPQSDFIKLEQQEVPSLLETMSVEPGVTLREKGASKQGPKEEASDSRMTRADFMTLVQSTADIAQQSSFQEIHEVRGSPLIPLV